MPASLAGHQMPRVALHLISTVIGGLLERSSKPNLNPVQLWRILMAAIVLSHFIPLFKTNKLLFFKALEGVSPEHLAQRPSPQSNPMIWIAGHLVYSRAGLARIAGAEIEEIAWSSMFRRGVSIDDAPNYPAIEEIAEQWKLVSGILMNRMLELNDAELEQPSAFNVPAGEQTVRGAVAFLNFHETYHVGQLAYLRKFFGYSQLVG